MAWVVTEVTRLQKGSSPLFFEDSISDKNRDVIRSPSARRKPAYSEIRGLSLIKMW